MTPAEEALREHLRAAADTVHPRGGLDQIQAKPQKGPIPMTTTQTEVQRAATVQQILTAQRAELEAHAAAKQQDADAEKAAAAHALRQAADLSTVLDELHGQVREARVRLDRFRVEVSEARERLDRFRAAADKHADAADAHQREADAALAVIGGAEAVSARALATTDRVAAVSGPSTTHAHPAPWEQDPGDTQRSGLYPVAPSVPPGPAGPDQTRPEPAMPTPVQPERPEQQGETRG